MLFSELEYKIGIKSHNVEITIKEQPAHVFHEECLNQGLNSYKLLQQYLDDEEQALLFNPYTVIIFLP